MDEKIFLGEDEIPDKWYNIQADLKTPLDPPLNPATLEPAGPDDLKAIFPMELIKQEMSQERYIKVPDEVLDVYRLWRPTPLYRALKLEKALKTPAKIYYKWEGVSPPGSHKPNTAVAQAYYNKQAGIDRLATETGAGQWGSALAFSTSFFDLECTVYMVKISYEQKPYRKILMKEWGADCIASPSNITQAGRSILEKDPESTGSLGIAISEAVEDAATHDNTNYSLGSVLNYVVLHQTIMGLEAKKQFELIDEYPDALYGCVGGGSNFAGGVFPFVGDKITGKKPDLDVVACEPMACPTLTKGLYTYDFGDTARMTPLLKMYTLGHDFVPPPIHAGGLRYHGDSPLVCKLVKDGDIRAQAYYQNEVFEAASMFSKTEGFLLAPETAHCLKAVIDEALRCKESGEEKVLYFLNSGHGHFDLASYDAYHQGKLVDYEYPAELVKQSLANLPDTGGK
ncbi:MAG: TrpB-like pyridoxal phosphate-dependent enzyme [Candidatus Altiarchaeales archaeon ex4484_96]|nr:MAG: TrpB-like pyridoxal phosphate-dependent enzyme [Candidatus Altiarchaeales archaeon ex4484_96]